MKGGNTDSKALEVQGFDYDNVEQYGTVNLTGGKGKKGKGKRKSSSKFSEFDFEKEWKEFETSYNQKYGGASKKKKSSSSTKKKPAKKTSSTKKKPAKKTSSTKKPTKRKTQRGGDESGATFAPAQFFDEKATMSAPPTGPFQSAYGTINAVDGLDRNLAPYPNSSGQLTGGAKKKSSKTKKAKTATKTTKPKKDTKKDTKKDSKKDTKKDSKKDTKSTGKKTSVLDKIKKFFAM